MRQASYRQRILYKAGGTPALLLLDCDHVVLGIAVDQLDERIDSRLAWNFVHRNRELLTLLFNFVFLQIEIVAIGVEHANVDQVVQRNRVLLPFSIRPGLFHLDGQMDLVLASG